MATVTAVIQRVSRRLEDQEAGYQYAHWQKVDLLAALTFAIRLTGQLQPANFGQLRTFVLPEDGLLQTDCTAFLPPYTLLNKAGRRLRSLATTEETDSAWDMPLCAGDGGPLYLVQRSEQEFEAWPTDRGTTYQVRGLCVCIPEVTMGGTVPVDDTLLPAVEEIMMYYAYSYDKTSDAYTAKGNAHLNNAMSMMGVPRGKA